MTREETIADMIETARMSSKQEMSISFDRLEYAMGEILDDFESRTCESCKYYDSMNESSGLCQSLKSKMTGVDSDDGCNKWEAKK